MNNRASKSRVCGSAKGTVLLVDDEQPILNVYGRILREAGFAVVQLADGPSVPSMLATNEFDVVISDITLPGTSGIEILRAVRGHSPDLPVVLMTGGGSLESAVKAVEYGALRYLLKPVEPRVLTQTAEDAVRFREMARARRQAFELIGNIADQESDRVDLSVRFARALETLYMAFQPIVRWSTRDVFAYEALVRTNEASLRNPNDLFIAAEQLHRIHDVGRAVRRSVADSMKRTKRMGCVFVNLHPRDLDDAELLSPNAPLSQVADRVVLEVTERASLEGVDVRARLAALRNLGFRIALDDLGAGYAGLSSFAQLQPEVVKLDMSLIRAIDQEPTKQRLVETMSGLCCQLGMLVIAEGVETPSERDTVVGLGCDLLQGYLFAKPAPGFPVVTWESKESTAMFG